VPAFLLGWVSILVVTLALTDFVFTWVFRRRGRRCERAFIR